MKIIFDSLMLVVLVGIMLFIIGYGISEAWYRRRIYNHDPKLMDKKVIEITINNRVTDVVMFRANKEASEKL